MSMTLAKPRVRTISAKPPLLMLRGEMDEWIARYWEGEQNQLFSRSFAPTLDLSETDERFELQMDIPGMQASDIEVQVHGNTVTLSGSRKEEKSDQGKTFHRLERRTGAFSRTISLPCEVSEEKVTAEYAEGVLTVRLPKCDPPRARRVEVQG